MFANFLMALVVSIGKKIQVEIFRLSLGIGAVHYPGILLHRVRITSLLYCALWASYILSRADFDFQLFFLWNTAQDGKLEKMVYSRQIFFFYQCI